MKNIKKLYLNYTLMFSMAFMMMLPSSRVNAPTTNNKAIEIMDDLKEKFEFSLNKYHDNVFIKHIKVVDLNIVATYAFTEHILSTSSNSIENEYSGMALSHEYEDEIKRIASEYGIPYQIMLIIGCQESNGNWNNNGKISPTNDYGVFQINKINHAYIYEHLGYTSDDLLNDPIKNAEAAAYLIRDIMNHKSVKNINDIFGMYNAWTGWENNIHAVKYVTGCNKFMEEYLPNYEYDHNKYINSQKEIEYYDDNYVIGLISKKVGINENTQRLNKLMDFKANILKNNFEYSNVVFNYNKIEGKLVEMIESDNLTSQETWKEFYNYYLLEVNELLLQKRYDEAMSRYSRMIEVLEEYYSTKDYIRITEQKLIKTY